MAYGRGRAGEIQDHAGRPTSRRLRRRQSHCHPPRGLSDAEARAAFLRRFRPGKASDSPTPAGGVGAAATTATNHDAVVQGAVWLLPVGAVAVADAADANVGGAAAAATTAAAKVGTAAAVKAPGTASRARQGIASLASDHDLEHLAGCDRERRRY